MSRPVVPCLRYKNAPAALDFLCAAFGFERHAVYADESDPSIIHHAQLTLGDGMVMIGSAVDTEFTEAADMALAEELGGITASVYAVVDDVDHHAERAEAAGAEILLPPTDQDYGGREYTARDPEGNVWSFGGFDPYGG
jgi:uncharacterized glyoxalase superfamily protein PhnB